MPSAQKRSAIDSRGGNFDVQAKIFAQDAENFAGLDGTFLRNLHAEINPQIAAALRNFNALGGVLFGRDAPLQFKI